MFKLPDLRRRVTIGAGGVRTSGPQNTIGSSGGQERVTLTQNSMPAHSHSAEIIRGGGSTAFSGFEYVDNRLNATVQRRTTEFAGGGQPHSNMQPSLVVNKIIKY